MRELSGRLRQKGFGEAICEGVIQKLKGAKLLDDRAFVTFWIESRVHSRPMAKRFLEKELLAKGVDKPLIEEIFRESFPQEHDRASAEKLLLTRMKKWDPRDPKSVRRLYGFMLRRGFSHETVSELLEKRQRE